MLWASDFDCVNTPGCRGSYSNILTLIVPEPTHMYRASVLVLRYSRVVYLTLRVSQLGKSLPYKVYWKSKSGRRRCVAGKVEGYSWNDSATDDVSVRLRGLKRRTTFSWYVGGRRVASRTANTVPG
jgi:hypothetical protein